MSADEAEDSTAFAAELAGGVTVLADPRLVAIAAWGVAMEGSELSIPATYVLDRRGRVAWRDVGANMTDLPDADEVLAALRALRE